MTLDPNDKYVIVYKDGAIGPRFDKHLSDWLVRNGQPNPAYRIRVREKGAKTQSAQQAQTWGLYDDPPGPRA